MNFLFILGIPGPRGPRGPIGLPGPKGSAASKSFIKSNIDIVRLNDQTLFVKRMFYCLATSQNNARQEFFSGVKKNLVLFKKGVTNSACLWLSSNVFRRGQTFKHGLRSKFKMFGGHIYCFGRA